MGLDIYAGTLTRYYSHNWKTAVQQWAEKNGYTFQKITPSGPAADAEELSPVEIQRGVENWRDQILAAISQPSCALWPEDNERPYYTDKPDWDAFGAMLLVAACHTYDEPVPRTVEKRWDFMKYPVMDRLASDEERVWQADEDTILIWTDTEGYPVDCTMSPGGQYSKADIVEHTQYDTESLAKYAFSMFWRAMRFAEEQQVPILLDY